MTHSKRQAIISELSWHCQEPRKVEALLTDSERNSILKHGYVRRDVWDGIVPRIIDPSILKMEQ